MDEKEVLQTYDKDIAFFSLRAEQTGNEIFSKEAKRLREEKLHWERFFEETKDW